MSVITINGQIGSGGQEVGLELASKLGYNYFDRLIFTQVSRKINATVQAVAAKETSPSKFIDRITLFVQKMLERSALSGIGGEPYFGPGIETLLSSDYYSDKTNSPITQSHQLEDRTYIQVISEVIQELSHQGNVVIVGRGSNQILASHPSTLHVGIFAPLEMRVNLIMKREHLPSVEATAFIEQHESSRINYYKKFFNQHPYETSFYDIMLNMRNLSITEAADIIHHILIQKKM